MLLSSLCLPRRGDYLEFLARDTFAANINRAACLAVCWSVQIWFSRNACPSDMVSGVKIFTKCSFARFGTKHAALRQGMIAGMIRGFQETKLCHSTDTDTATNQRTMTRNWCLKPMHPKNGWFNLKFPVHFYPRDLQL